MENTEELYKSIPTEYASRFKKQIELMQNGVPEIWNMLISRQRICPCDFALPNFCVPCPNAENCKRCWEQAMKFNFESGISVSPAGYLLCSKCKKYLFFQGVVHGEDDKDHNVWICPDCEKTFELPFESPPSRKDQSRPQGWQPAATRVAEPEEDDEG